MGESSKKGNDYSPGWNDPPMLNYSPANPPPKSRIGNKRVAFPLGAATSPQVAGQTSEAPTIPPLPTVSGCPCIRHLFSEASENYTYLGTVPDNESIKGQISEMLFAWEHGKFSANIQKALTDLATSIMKGNTTAINEIHSKLMSSSDIVLIKDYLPAVNFLSGKP